MIELETKEWTLILISSVLSVLLSKYLPETPFQVFNIEFIDIIITALIIGLLILIYIAIVLWMGSMVMRGIRLISRISG